MGGTHSSGPTTCGTCCCTDSAWNASYKVDSSQTGELVVVAWLPGLSSAAEAELEVAELELKVRSVRPDLPHCLSIPLPKAVDPSSSKAKWSKRSQQLTIHLLLQN